MNTFFEIPLGDEQESADATETPDLLAFITSIACMKQDGEGGFVMENDDAVTTLNELIDYARILIDNTGNKYTDVQNSIKESKAELLEALKEIAKGECGSRERVAIARAAIAKVESK